MIEMHVGLVELLLHDFQTNAGTFREETGLEKNAEIGLVRVRLRSCKYSVGEGVGWVRGEGWGGVFFEGWLEQV
jgi:hypothetical protein